LKQTRFSVGCHGKNTGLILCVFFKQGTTWKLLNASHPGAGRNFKELEPEILSYLSTQNIVTKDMILEGANWNPASGKVFVLSKVT
jgi:hypothetical protein